MPTYIIRAGADGPVKIGRADDVQERLAHLQTANPERLDLLRVVDTPFDAEPIFHERFKHLRIRGEWFRFDAAMLTFIPQPAQTPNYLWLWFSRALATMGPRNIAGRIGVSPRTVENWIGAKNAPNWRQTCALLQDRELAPIYLTAMGREDLATAKPLAELKAELADVERQIEVKRRARQAEALLTQQRKRTH